MPAYYIPRTKAGLIKWLTDFYKQNDVLEPEKFGWKEKVKRFKAMDKKQLYAIFYSIRGKL